MDKKDGGTIDLESLRGFTPGPHPDAQPAQGECFCDRMKLGAPGVSCGDCPTRDYAPQPAPAPVQVEGWWRVEVSDSAGQIVAIEPGMLAGRDVGCGSDDATIRLVVEHLRSFIGEPAHPPAPAADGAGELPRYGIRWNGPTQPISVPIGDGYWTPWHLAHAAIAALQAQQPGAQAVDLYTVDDSAQACSDGCCGGCQFRPYIPHPPSIPEPSEEDVDVACEALDFDNDVFAHMRERVQGVLATYTARLRERIGGGA